ncbi:kynureninase [Sphingomonas mucosissima]|uniref:Kynureninase n=1 Tax=Sphingomonas mucosissima TaxID=370959 RepID=A0A245ZH43_9SPHN|nr:kynureninase [Sphingomonas mucosissima]OWK29075.1 kynureninase [Sphingomonas mucosissima]
MNWPDLATVQAMDMADPLRACRARFTLPEGLIYLDGNSLGALPRDAPARVAAAVEEQWGSDLIASWNKHGWIEAPARLGARIAPLIGAGEDEVIVADSTSANLFKLITAACLAQPGRTTILTEPGNFPTDLYIAQGVAEVLPGRRVRTVPAGEMAAAIDGNTAVVVLTHVHYKTGAKLDMASLTAAAHAAGALILWDLSHSAGGVEVDLGGCDADLAVGCGYKYLNGGPGAPAFLYVARRWQERLRSPLTGWMGHKTPFDFGDDYAPAEGMKRFLCGTPPILGMAALDAGLDSFAGVTMAEVTAKSRSLSELLIAGIEQRCGEARFTLVTPRDPAARGSHVSVAHEHAWEICQALIAHGVVGDFRAPNVLRLGLTPLYTSHEDVWRAVEIIAAVMEAGAWRDPAYAARAAVT